MLLVPVQMRRFEKIGLTRAQSEQMTEMLTEVVCLNKEKVVQQFVSKPALEKVRYQLATASWGLGSLTGVDEHAAHVLGGAAWVVLHGRQDHLWMASAGHSGAGVTNSWV